MASEAQARPAQRVVARLVTQFLLLTVKSIGVPEPRDYKRGIVALAILQASGGRAGAPAVSINALAASLAFPYETMRRHVGELIAAGLCARLGRKGVVICEEPRALALFGRQRRAIADNFLNMLADFKAIGFDFESLGQAEEAAPAPRIFAAATDHALLTELACDFLLRQLEVTLPVHDSDLERNLVFASIVSANTAAIAYDRDMTWRYGEAEKPLPDLLRQPVSIRTLSYSLDMPFETTRRHVNALLRRRRCIKMDNRGVIVPAEVMQSPPLLQARAMMTLRFVQCLAELKRLAFDFSSLDARGETARLRSDKNAAA